MLHTVNDIYAFLIFGLTVSMVMFSTFEHSVDLIYRKIMHRRKEDCSTAQQLGVTCLAAYTAGAVGTVISNPADNVMTSLYKKKAESAMQVGFHVMPWFI